MRSISICMLLLSLLTVGLALLTGCSGSSKPSEMVALSLHEDDAGMTPLNADWIAFQDGAGAWQQIIASEPGVYIGAVSDAAGRYGFAYVYNGYLHLVHGTLVEGTEIAAYPDTGYYFTRKDATSRTTTYSIMGSISYDFTPGNSSAMVYRSNSSSNPISSYASQVPAGLCDLAITDNTWTQPRLMNWLWLERDISVTANTTHNVTVHQADVIQLENGASVSVTGDTNDMNATVSYITANNTLFMLANYDNLAGAAAINFNSVPAAQAVATDYYFLRAYKGNVELKAAFDSPTGFAVNVPSGDFSSYQVSTVNVGGNAYPVFSGLSQTGNLGYYLYTKLGSNYREVTVTRGWLNANGATSYQAPNLTNVPGWQAAWNSAAGATHSDDFGMALDGNISLFKALGHYFDNRHNTPTPGEWYSVVRVD